MRFAATCVCFLAVLTWLETTEASPFENFFQKGKDMFKQMAGGDSNPFVGMGQQFADMMGFDKHQKEVHEQFSAMMENAGEEMKKKFEEGMAEMQKMAMAGASKDDMKKKYAEMLDAFSKSKS